MIYSHEVEEMCTVAQGVCHGAAPIPEEAKWVKAKEVKDISGLTHGVGWCAPQQGACKLTLNVKEGVIQEALVETIGCSGMTHSAAMASEILRRWTSYRSRIGRFRQGPSLSGRHYVWNIKKRTPLLGDGRRICYRDCSGCRKPYYWLSICQSWKNDRFY